MASSADKLLHFAILCAPLLLAACKTNSQACEGLSRDQALTIVLDRKAGMLSRSAKEYAANFKSDEITFVRVGAKTNGYAANVGFKGRDGRTLTALVYSDCHVGWTG